MTNTAGASGTTRERRAELRQELYLGGATPRDGSPIDVGGYYSITELELIALLDDADALDEAREQLAAVSAERDAAREELSELRLRILYYEVVEQRNVAMCLVAKEKP